MGDKECLKCKIEADENMAFGSKEPELKPCGAQQRVQQILRHWVDENRAVKNRSKPEEGVSEEQVWDNVKQLTTSG